MIMAIVLMALVALALASLAALVAYDARRTRDARTDAQLRQLLLAGTAAAIDRARSAPPEADAHPWPVSLPQTLADDGATLTVKLSATGPEGTEARIDATSEERSLGQTVVLVQRNGQWAVKSAVVDR